MIVLRVRYGIQWGFVREMNVFTRACKILPRLRAERELVIQ